MDSPRDRTPRRSGRLVASIALAVSSLALSVPGAALAAPPTNAIEVTPETDVVAAGLPVVLTARLDASGPGNRRDGELVRFFFAPGSPNDSPGSPDFVCTLALGACSISYVPAVDGTDVICATTAGDDRRCDYARPGRQGGNRGAVVHRTVVNGLGRPVGAPPRPSIEPPSLTPSPTPVPTPVPAIRPTPSVTPAPVGSAKAPSPLVELATTDVVPGQVVTLSVWILTSDGAPAAGREADDVVGFYFLPGSPNELATRRNKPDLSCRTGSDAFCSVTYLARNLGIDTICAYTGPQGRWERSCAEPWDGRDLDNASDVVRRRVMARGPTPATLPPTPTTSAAPSATPSPTPEPLVVPTAPGRRGTPPASVAPAGVPVPAPAAPVEPDVGRFFWQVWSAIAEGVERAVRPEAAARVATTFGFPLALMVAVLLFLVVQDQVDRRDPKLRRAPRTVTDTMQKFRDEDELYDR